MRSRHLRDGIAGLLILAGLVGATGLYFWLNNRTLNNRGYTFAVRFDDAGGLLPGAAVRLRGVQIGRVESIEPGADSVLVGVSITNNAIAIPRDATVLSNQTGLIGETALEISPRTVVVLDPESGITPVSELCDPAQLICQGDVIEGRLGVNYTQLVLQLDSLVSRIDDEAFFQRFADLTESITEAAEAFSSLSQSLENEVDFESFTAAADSLSGAADEVQATASRMNTAIERLEPQLSTALDEVTAFSSDIRAITSSLRPVLSEPQFGDNLSQSVDQLAIATTEAAAAATHFNTLVAGISDPDTIASLRTTLDSARVTFENAEKITADLDEMTGDPAFRDNFRRLVEGLGNLVSTAPGSVQPVSFSPVTFRQQL